MSNNQIMPANEQLLQPLANIYDFLTPRILEDRRAKILELSRAWVIEELSIYGKTYHTDDVQFEAEIQKVRANFDFDGKPASFTAFQLQLKITGLEPHHATVEVDSLFIINKDDMIENLVLSKAAPLTDEPPTVN